MVSRWLNQIGRMRGRHWAWRCGVGVGGALSQRGGARLTMTWSGNTSNSRLVRTYEFTRKNETSRARSRGSSDISTEIAEFWWARSR